MPAPAGIPLPKAVCLGVMLGVAGCQTSASNEAAPDTNQHLSMFAALQDALEHRASGETVRWADPTRGQSGSVVPVRTFLSASGNPCREYTLVIVEAGQTQEQAAIACRNGDGEWTDGP